SQSSCWAKVRISRVIPAMSSYGQSLGSVSCMMMNRSVPGCGDFLPRFGDVLEHVFSSGEMLVAGVHVGKHEVTNDEFVRGDEALRDVATLFGINTCSEPGINNVDGS